jgi:LacI family transcriptional regulator
VIEILKTEKQNNRVIIPNILNSFFAKVLAVSKKWQMKKGTTLLCVSNESMDKEAHTLEMLSNGTIDGFFYQCLKKHKNGEYNHFPPLLMMVLL